HVTRRAGVRERDALALVAGDHVGGAGHEGGTADGVEAGTEGDADALGVAQGGVAGGGGADVVAPHHGTVGAGVPGHGALLEVGGDDVPLPGYGAADDVAAGAFGEPDARAVAQGGVARRGRADEVALDRVAGRAGVEEGDAAPVVARDDVAGRGGAAADRVV